MKTDPSTPAIVWCCETIDYPGDETFWGVWSSPEKAYEGIKVIYGPPYVVGWSDLRKDEEGDGYEFTGTFDRVPDHSIAHTQEYRIWREEVDARR